MSSLETSGVGPTALASASQQTAVLPASAAPTLRVGGALETSTYQIAPAADRNKVVLSDDLERVAQTRSRVTWMPLALMLPSERRLAVGLAQFATTQQRLARSLVKARGHANQDDVEAMVAKLVQLPPGVLMGIQRAGRSFVVCRGGVTDYLGGLKNVPVRGHPPSDTWDTVPGTAWNDEVVIATMENPLVPGERIIPPRGVRHGSYDLVMHELGHAIVRHFGQFRGIRSTPDSIDAYSTPAFLSARAHDWARLPAYYRQGGTASGAGADETFAESFARYYGRDPTLARDWSGVYRYWNDGPPALRVAPSAAE